MGLLRQLSAGEIAGQVRVLAHTTKLADSTFNIVLMGMGEPLHNYDATMKALRILADPDGFALHPKRVTLSTVGLLPALERLATEPLMPNLAISLHATTDEARSRLVPINKRYPIEDLMAALRRFPLAKRRRITFEYVLLAGVNDTPEDARRLVRLLNGLRAKVNLLPLNEAPGIPFTRPSDDRVNAFARILAERDVRVSVRKSRGRDIRAACGQLVSRRPETTGRPPAGRSHHLNSSGATSFRWCRHTVHSWRPSVTRYVCLMPFAVSASVNVFDPAPTSVSSLPIAIQNVLNC